jgi:hypothetical protein
MGRGPPAGRSSVCLGADARDAAEIAHFVDEVLAPLQGQAVGEIRCDASGLESDLRAVELLARIALAARRRNVPISFHGVRPGLRDLIELAGLADTLAMVPARPAHPGVTAARTAGRSGASPGRT